MLPCVTALNCSRDRMFGRVLLFRYKVLKRRRRREHLLQRVKYQHTEQKAEEVLHKSCSLAE